jgi:aspartyl-tRNA(Asn)/glutamyl-tRNA(Gln) amidotransferase subunit C
MTVHLPLHEGALSLEQWQRLEDLAKTLTPEQALAGAPERDGDLFKVSSILGEEQ